MGYDVNMIVGEASHDGGIFEVATLDMKKIGSGPLMERLTGHDYDHPDHWLYAGHNGYKFNEAVAASTETTLYSEGERRPNEVDKFVVDLWNDEIREDQYGEKLKAVPIDEVISLLREEIKSDESNPYRRFVLALALLESVKEGWSSSERMTVLFYGH